MNISPEFKERVDALVTQILLGEGADLAQKADNHAKRMAKIGFPVPSSCVVQKSAAAMLYDIAKQINGMDSRQPERPAEEYQA